MNSQDHYERARKRVKEKKDFYSHFTTYLIMGAFFFTLNMLTSPGSWWFYWPMLGWGIGLASHYFKVFGWPGSGAGSKEWENREIEKEMHRLEEQEEPFLDIDEHLELKETTSEKEKIKTYRKDDFV